MKADLSPVGKGTAVGRPRDPRIDAAILSAAAELVVEVGYSNLTLAAIAERAGTTKTALYRRWSSKAELVHEAVFAMPPSVLTSSAGDAAADVRAMIADARDAFTHPAVRAALPGLLVDMAGDTELTARVLARFDDRFEALRQWVGEAIERGEVRREVDPDRLVELIGGATLFSLLLEPDADLGEEWVDRTAAMVVHGVVT